MKNKKIAIIIRKSPFHDVRAAEAMRIGVGLTLRDIGVYVFFLEEGIEALIKGTEGLTEEPDFLKHLTTLVELKQTLVMGSESVDSIKDLHLIVKPETWEKASIFQFITHCSGVVSV